MALQVSCSVQLSYYSIGYMRSIAIQHTALDYLQVCNWANNKER